jgi:hypothetical protein
MHLTEAWTRDVTAIIFQRLPIVVDVAVQKMKHQLRGRGGPNADCETIDPLRPFRCEIPRLHRNAVDFNEPHGAGHRFFTAFSETVTGG